MDERKQINVRVDDAVLAAIDDIRALSRPIPSLSEVIRSAIIRERDRVRREVARQGPEQAYREIVGPSGAWREV